MGNELATVSTQDKQAKQFAEFLSNRKSKQSSTQLTERTDKYSFSPELKWRNDFLSALEKLSMLPGRSELAEDLKQVIKKIKLDYFVRAISILDALSPKEVLDLNSKQVIKESFNLKAIRHSQNVFVDLGPRYAPKESIQTQITESPDRFRKKVDITRERKAVSQIIIRELNEAHHPVRCIKQWFVLYFEMKYRNLIDEKGKIVDDENMRDSFYQKIRSDIDFYCELITEGCPIYKKWVIKHARLRQDKYKGFVKKIILDSLFTSPHNLHPVVFKVVKELNEPYIKPIIEKLPDNLPIDRFHVIKQLQIEGNYIAASFKLEDADQLTSPKRLLALLEDLKEEICNDIDHYHQLFKTDKNYTIDGDNMLGILCFLLAKFKPKLLEIYSQLAFLYSVYGDALNMNFESASYMATTIQASIDHFSSPEFVQELLVKSANKLGSTSTQSVATAG